MLSGGGGPSRPGVFLISMQCWAGGLSQQCPSSLPNRTGCRERACPQPTACQQSRRSQQALRRGLHRNKHRSRAQPEAVAGSLPADARTGLPDLPAPELPAAAQGKSLGSLALRVIFGTALGAVGLVVITGGGWTFTLAVCLIVYQVTQVRHCRPCPACRCRSEAVAATLQAVRPSDGPCSTTNLHAALRPGCQHALSHAPRPKAAVCVPPDCVPLPAGVLRLCDLCGNLTGPQPAPAAGQRPHHGQLHRPEHLHARHAGQGHSFAGSGLLCSPGSAHLAHAQAAVLTAGVSCLWPVLLR